VFPHESVRRADDTRYLVTTGSGEVELNVATGQARPVDGEPVAWCSQPARYDPAVEVAGRSSNELAVTQWWPCLADGTPVELPTTTPEFAGYGWARSSPGSATGRCGRSPCRTRPADRNGLRALAVCVPSRSACPRGLRALAVCVPSRSAMRGGGTVDRCRH
jgi:hypothetical protein